MDPPTKSSNKPRGTRNNDTADTGLRRLTVLFCSWKSILLLIAVLSPGPGYDTSTQILLQQYQALSGSWLEALVSKLTRWDAIYFANSSTQGHVFEQAWAFSPFLAKITSLVARVFPFTRIGSPLVRHAAAGITISHVSHLLAVIVLYQLTFDLIPATYGRKKEIAFTTACLHIVSPGGLFLSASYGESFFALANFAGSFCYSVGRRHEDSEQPHTALRSAFWTSVSGVLFGIATMIRGNGLLSGIFFAWDAILYVPKLSGMMRQTRQRAWSDFVQLIGLLLGGLAIAIGYAIPQFQAYLEYCTGGNTRPWCTTIPPSIYSFVQTHYWNVGFLRYWTAGNIPLFALAAPMLLVLISTGWMAMSRSHIDQLIEAVGLRHGTKSPATLSSLQEKDIFRCHMARFALPQMVLAVLALTSFHVQIINRISSGYPVWYILLACAVHTPELATKGDSTILRSFAKYSQWLVRASVMYAMIQGGLYASFMPPA